MGHLIFDKSVINAHWEHDRWFGKTIYTQSNYIETLFSILHKNQFKRDDILKHETPSCKNFKRKYRKKLFGLTLWV